MEAITTVRKAGWYVTHADGDVYTDLDGHMWFTKELARQHAIVLGGMYQPGPSGTIKTVVTGYTED
jgi:hypothetical protein